MSDHPVSTRPPGNENIGVIIGTVKSFIAVVFGAVLVLIGIPLAIITPFPFVPIGAIVIVAGLAIIARNSRTARAFVYRFLRRNPSLRARVPNWMSRVFLGRSVADDPSADDVGTQSR